MPQSDNLYTLDAVDTNLTATTQVVKALQVATTDVSTQRLNEGLASFGAAIGQVATRKRAERVKEDMRTAKNAAIRNESMPGGLAIESVEAYNYTTSVVAGNEHLKTAGMYYEGDEFKAILNSTELTEDQKIASIEQSSSEFLLNGQYALNQHPDLYLKYMNGLDEYKTAAIKSIHGVEKTKQEFTGIQAMQGQIENRIKDGVEITGEYIVNLAESYRKATPWVDPDVAKITALNLVLSAPETTSQTLAAIMKSEYAKGVGGNKGPTFGSLANSQTGAGQLIFKQVTEFTARRKREKAEAKQAEIDRETDLNNKGLEATEEFVSSLKTDDPNRVSQVNQFMKDQGMTGKARTAFMRIYKGDLENSTQDSNSDDYDNLADQILEDYLTGREAIQDAAAAHNLSGEAVRNLLTLDANTKSLVNTHRSRIIADGATLNNSADAGLLSALAGSSGSGKLARLLDPRLKDPSVSSAEKVSIMMRKGVIKVPYADKIPVLMDLLEIRKQFDKGAREEARLAVIEDREPDSTALINRFQTRVTNLLNRLNTPTVQVPPKDSKDPKVPKDPPTGTIDKTKILDAATGDPEAGQSLVDSVLDMFKAKVEKPKSFREISESNRMDKPPVKTTPEVPQEKPTQDNILGSSSTPSITQRAKLLSLNPEGRRGTSAFKQEVRETGQIEDKESAIAENLSYFSEAEGKKEQSAWEHFKEVFAKWDDKYLSVGPNEKTAIEKGASVLNDIVGFGVDEAEGGAAFDPDKALTREELVAQSATPNLTSQSFADEQGKPGDILVLGKWTGQVTSEGRKVYENNKGGVSSEYTIGVKDPKINNGELTDIPSIYNGKIVTEQEAIRIISENKGIDPETGRFITPGGDPEARSKSISIDRTVTEIADSFGDFEDNAVDPLGFNRTVTEIADSFGDPKARSEGIISQEQERQERVLAKAEELASIYNASTPNQQSGWVSNGRERYTAYKEGNTTSVQNANIQALKDTLLNYQETFEGDLSTIEGLSFEDFQEYMILTYGAETHFGADTLSPTGVVGELQVTRPTLLGEWKKDSSGADVLPRTTWIPGVIGGNKNFGPKMAEAFGFTLKQVDASSTTSSKRTLLVKNGETRTDEQLISAADTDLKSLLQNRTNKDFSFMAGIAVMLNKLQR